MYPKPPLTGFPPERGGFGYASGAPGAAWKRREDGDCVLYAAVIGMVLRLS